MNYTTDEFPYNKDSKCFSVYESDLGGGMPKEFTITNPKTNNKATFEFTHFDYDNSHEDIYGANYKCKEYPSITALIIND